MRPAKSSIVITIGATVCFTILFLNHGNTEKLHELRSDKPHVISVEEDIDNLRRELATNAPEENTQNSKNKKKLNVLFMITDDMRPQLGCYKGVDYANPTLQQEVFTPHLDKLASKSLLLRRAYTQYSLCGPSRASMMTSRRPDTTRIYGNQLYWRNVGGNYTTLPQYFKDKGYHSIGIGKIYHQFESSNNQDPMSWSEPHYDPPYSDGHFYDLPAAGYRAVTDHERQTISPLTDEHGIIRAKEKIKELAKQYQSGKPFFFAFGFSKPHLNFVAPKKFFDLYKLESGKQFLSDIAWQRPIVGQYCNMENVTIENGEKRITDEGLRHLRRAYFACISFVDYMVGQLLEELDKHGLTDSTVVSFVADHGHHLGENELWGKQSHFDSSIHIPMMIHIPDQTNHGIITRSLAEGVDVLPTVVEAAGLDSVPKCPKDPYDVSVCTEGQSLLPLISQPDLDIKPAVYTQLQKKYSYMAYTIRTKRYKFMQHAKLIKKSQDDNRKQFHVEWDEDQYWTELYDIDLDPEERVNITDHSQYSDVKHQLQTHLHNFVIDVHNVPG